MKGMDAGKTANTSAILVLYFAKGNKGEKGRNLCAKKLLKSAKKFLAFRPLLMGSQTVDCVKRFLH